MGQPVNSPFVYFFYFLLVKCITNASLSFDSWIITLDKSNFSAWFQKAVFYSKSGVNSLDSWLKSPYLLRGTLLQKRRKINNMTEVISTVFFERTLKSELFVWSEIRSEKGVVQHRDGTWSAPLGYVMCRLAAASSSTLVNPAIKNRHRLIKNSHCSIGV